MGRGPKVAVHPIRPGFLAGEPVTARVSVTGGGGLVAERCQVELLARIWNGRTRKQGLGTFPVSVNAPEDRVAVVSRAEVASLAGAVLPPSAVTGEVTLPDAPSCPSGKTRRVSVSYVLTARLQLASGRKVAASAPVVVVIPRRLYQQVEGTECFRRTQRCDLDLELPAPHARPGEAIEGVLRVHPREPVHAHLVLRQLYTRSAPGIGGTPTPVLTQGLACFPPARSLRWAPRSLRLARDVMLSGPAEFPFRIPVRGNACPTFITQDLAVRHYVSGEVHYRNRRASLDVLIREVNIHTA